MMQTQVEFHDANQSRVTNYQSQVEFPDANPSGVTNYQTQVEFCMMQTQVELLIIKPK